MYFTLYNYVIIQEGIFTFYFVYYSLQYAHTRHVGLQERGHMPTATTAINLD